MAENVVPLFPQGVPLSAFEQAWALYPIIGRQRSNRAEAMQSWRKVADQIGDEELLGRVRRYVAEDEDHRRHGPPGFHRWLNWGRWEHWSPLQQQAAERPPEFPDPIMRESFHLRFHDERPRKWFDRCSWNADAREIKSPWPIRLSWLQGPFMQWAKLNGVAGIVTDTFD